MRILLADDHPGVRATTSAMLQDAGHSVLEAAGGAEVFALLDDNPDCCDLIVSDYAMPGVSGVEVVKRARALRPGMPGIIITGYADTASIANRPSDVLVLAKPFTPDQLSNAVKIVHARANEPTAKAVNS